MGYFNACINFFYQSNYGGILKFCTNVLVSESKPKIFHSLNIMGLTRSQAAVFFMLNSIFFIYQPALAASPDDPWWPRRDGDTSASGVPGRPPSSCPCRGAAYSGSLGGRGLPLTCACEGRCGCPWRPPLEGLSHLGTAVGGSGARCLLGMLPSGCSWSVLMEEKDEGLKRVSWSF